MKIIKYKYLNDGLYEITLDDRVITVYEDSIIKNNILLKKEITSKELDNLMKDEEFYEIKRRLINLLNKRLYTKMELLDIIKKEYKDSKLGKEVLDNLSKEGYINDLKYTELYYDDVIRLKNYGPLKVKEELLKKRVDEDIINKCEYLYNKDIETSKIKAYILKKVKLNKDKSSKYLKDKIKYELNNLGYHIELVSMLLDDYDINDEDIYKKEYEKTLEKLKKKYSGKELEYKIKQKMYQKGFNIYE